MSTLTPKVKNTSTSPEKTNIKIEDDRTGMNKETLKRAFLDHLFYIQGVDRSKASLRDYYMALSYTVRDRLLHRFLKTIETYKKEEVKIVSYFSAEFLMGRHLGNNLVNLGIYDTMKDIMTEMKIYF